jgi:hypothetical protein
MTISVHQFKLRREALFPAIVQFSRFQNSRGGVAAFAQRLAAEVIRPRTH